MHHPTPRPQNLLSTVIVDIKETTVHASSPAATATSVGVVRSCGAAALRRLQAHPLAAVHAASCLAVDPLRSALSPLLAVAAASASSLQVYHLLAGRRDRRLAELRVIAVYSVDGADKSARLGLAPSSGRPGSRGGLLGRRLLPARLTAPCSPSIPTHRSCGGGCCVSPPERGRGRRAAGGAGAGVK